MAVVRHRRFYDPTIEKLKETKQLNQDKKDGLVGVLLDHSSLYQPIPEPFVMPGFELSTDSGAHTLYKKFFVQGEQATEYARKNADYSYLDTQEFKDFLDHYIQHLLEYKHLYTFYVTLDIINNPEKSWEITKYIESYGLSPIPVFHNGEDIKWLHKMLDEYPYFGISGLGQDITKQKFKSFGDACFNAICDRHGVPRAKVHGFAMGTPEILAQYPWYSADQSTWTYMCRVGSLLVPKQILKGSKLVGYDYMTRYKVLPVTERRRFEPLHVDNITSALTLKWITEFVEREGFTLEEAKQFYHVRDILNIRLFSRIQDAAKKLYEQNWGYGQGGNILFAGTPAGASTNLSRLCKLLYDVKVHGMHWLGTPVYNKLLHNCLAVKTATLSGTDYRSLWDEQEAASKRAPVVVKPRIIKKKIARVPLVKPGKLYDVTLEVTLPVMAASKEQATLLAVELLQSHEKVVVVHQHTELHPIMDSTTTEVGSFETLL